MSYIKEYAQKLVTAEEAVKVVKSNDWVDYGWTTGTPVALDAALAARADELENVNISNVAADSTNAVWKDNGSDAWKNAPVTVNGGTCIVEP